jgi:hypothetical protein
MQLSDFSLKPRLSHFRKPLPDDSYEVFKYDGRLYDYLRVDQIEELASSDSKETYSGIR